MSKLDNVVIQMISVCILTKNAEKTLPATLDSVKSFPEVLLLDTGSTDATLSLASQYPNVAIYEAPFCGFGDLRNNIALLAKNDWILALDSDEIVSPALLQEIFSLSLSPSFAYVLPRHNYYNGKRIKGCGWNPDLVARLYNRKNIQFSPAKVHESLEAKKRVFCKSPLLHTPYQSTADFLSKMQHYSTLFAEQYKGIRKSSFKKAFCRAIFTFFRSYILRRGILDGAEGFTISLYNANTTFYKYMKLAEINQKGFSPLQ